MLGSIEEHAEEEYALKQEQLEISRAVGTCL